MHEPSRAVPSQFALKFGERITACFPLLTSGSDRMLEELAGCNYCLHRTYRVVVVASAEGLQRRAALCVRHFTEAARIFPELKRLSA
jgi:hypothetical protein